MSVNISTIQGYALVRDAMGAKVSNIQAYGLIKPPAPLSLRTFNGYAMGQPANTVNLRTLNGYAMVPFAKLPTGANGASSLMTLILQKSKSVRPASQFSLGPVEVASDLAGYDTKALLTAQPSSLLSGSMYWYYNRAPMNKLSSAGNIAGITIGAAANTHALISAINTATGMVLTTADIVNTPIVAGSVEVTITAADTSYIFAPGSTVNIGFTPSLASVFKSDMLLFP